MTNERDLRKARPRLTGPEFFQACAYAAIATWAVVFWVFPPAAFVTALDANTRIFWLLAVLVGATTALVGLITRIDLKVELPGIIFSIFGPLAYAMSQLYYVVYPPTPPPGFRPVNPHDRYALIIYATIPIWFLMVRMWQLVRQARLAKGARRASKSTAIHLIEDRSDTGPVVVVPMPKRPAHEVMRDAENLLHGGDDE